MIRAREIAAAVAVVLLGSVDVADAAKLCGDRAEILQRLEQRHGETVQGLGLSSDGGVLELVVSPDGGFTLIVTYPQRPTCVVAVGEAWQALTPISGDPA